jgi:hypothetical protein
VAVLFAEEGADLVLCDLQPDSRLPEETPRWWLDVLVSAAGMSGTHLDTMWLPRR